MNTEPPIARFANGQSIAAARLSQSFGRGGASMGLADQLADQLADLAQSLVDEWPNFFQKKGAGAGDRDTNAFMKELRARAKVALGSDFGEGRICGDNKLAPDYYFPDEATIVEIAMGLRNPSSEFERDILKAIMAQEAGNQVRRLLFLSKPGAVARCSQPGLRAFADWALRAHNIVVEVREFTPAVEAVLEPAAEPLRAEPGAAADGGGT